MEKSKKYSLESKQNLKKIADSIRKIYKNITTLPDSLTIEEIAEQLSSTKQQAVFYGTYSNVVQDALTINNDNYAIEQSEFLENIALILREATETEDSLSVYQMGEILDNNFLIAFNEPREIIFTKKIETSSLDEEIRLQIGIDEDYRLTWSNIDTIEKNTIYTHTHPTTKNITFKYKVVKIQKIPQNWNTDTGTYSNYYIYYTIAIYPIEEREVGLINVLLQGTNNVQIDIASHKQNKDQDNNTNSDTLVGEGKKIYEPYTTQDNQITVNFNNINKDVSSNKWFFSIHDEYYTYLCGLFSVDMEANPACEGSSVLLSAPNDEVGFSTQNYNFTQGDTSEDYSFYLNARTCNFSKNRIFYIRLFNSELVEGYKAEWKIKLEERNMTITKTY